METTHRSSLPSSKVFKIVTLGLLLFCLCVAYCILRNLKDAVTLTSHGAGAEVIPFIKVWGMLPAALCMTVVFTFLSRHFQIATVSAILISCFLCYYLLFVFWIYPNQDWLRLEQLGRWLTLYLPEGARGWIQMVENWPATSFYILSELWATTLVGVLFWGVANDVNTEEEAKSTYGLIKVGATSSALAAGVLAGVLTSDVYNPALPFGSNAWEQTLTKAILCVVALGIVSLALFFFLASQRQIVSNRDNQRVRLSLGKSLRVVAGSPYLLGICMLVLGYNLAFNMTDVLWKQKVKDSLDGANAVMGFMNRVTALVGLISVVAALSSSFLVRRFGWTTLAMLTPVAMLVTGGGFYTLYLSGDLLVAAPAAWILSLGAMTNCISKAAKYSVFDVSKELAFTPLDRDTKWSGKAAIDGIGNDIGKTGASLAHQGLLILFANLSASAPVICVIVISVLVVWCIAARYVGSCLEGKQVSSLSLA